MTAKATTPQQHMMLEAHWPNDCCLCRLEYENAILRLGLEEAEAHCRNHHLEACETCAANESETIALRKLAGFLRSVILSGEKWTDTCQREYDAALAAGRDAPGKRLRGDENVLPTKEPTA